MNTTTEVERKELGKWLNVLIAKHAKRSGVKNIQAWVLDNFFWEIVDFILKDRAKHATAVRKQVAEEILDEIGKLPHGHTPDGKTHRYYPDFYVNDWDTFVETKGWYNESQQAKVAAIRASHPTMTLIIVTKPLLEMYERCIKQPLLPFQ